MWNQNITPWIIVSQLQLSILQLSPVTRKVCNSLKSHILYATFVISNNKQLKGLLLCDKKEHKIYCSKKGENVNDKTIIYIDLFFSISTSRQNLEFDINNYTACFGKVYRTIFQSKRRQNRGHVHSKWYLSKLLENIFKYIHIYIFHFCYKIKT